MVRWRVDSVYVLLTIALLLSTVIVLNSVGVITFGNEQFLTAKNYALSLVEYNVNLAQDLGVPENDARVNLAYRRLHEAIENAASPEELFHIILTEMSKFEQVVREQANFNLTSWLEWVINRDPNIGGVESSTDIKISFLADQQVAIEGGDFLEEATLEKIYSYNIPSALRLQTVTIAIESNEGAVSTRIKEPEMEQDPFLHLQNQFQYLEQELDNLQTIAGFSELVGPGLRISLMDAEDNLITNSTNIIHDFDVQEVVHMLNASGAKGIAVGDRRLIATSSIRCVGGPILVNYEPVPVKPLIITAVGDPEEMADYLESLLDYYVNERRLRVEVLPLPEVRLPAHSRR